MIIAYRERSYEPTTGEPDGKGRVLLTGDFPTEAAAAAHCARNGISLASADLRGVVWDGADLSELHVPHSDLTGASLRSVRATGPRVAEFSACIFGATTVITGSMTHANFACAGAPGVFRVELGERSNLRGCNWDACEDVIRLPVKDDHAGQVYAVRNGTGWKVCANARGVLLEAEARVLGARYAAALDYLESPEGQARKAAIEARPAAMDPVGEAEAKKL